MAGKGYYDRCKELRQAAQNGDEVDWQSRGSPHLFLIIALLSAGQTAYADEETQDQVCATMENLSKFDVQEMVQLVRVFKNVHKQQEGKPKMAHFTWALDHIHPHAEELTTTILTLFRQAGGTRLTGAAPRGPLERDIVRLLNGKGTGKGQ